MPSVVTNVPACIFVLPASMGKGGVSRNSCQLRLKQGKSPSVRHLLVGLLLLLLETDRDCHGLKSTEFPFSPNSCVQCLTILLTEASGPSITRTSKVWKCLTRMVGIVQNVKDDLSVAARGEGWHLPHAQDGITKKQKVKVKRERENGQFPPDYRRTVCGVQQEEKEGIYRMCKSVSHRIKKKDKQKKG
jgi:hypothetical protein